MTDLVIRPLHAGEEAPFLSMPGPGRDTITPAGRDYRIVAAAGP